MGLHSPFFWPLHIRVGVGPSCTTPTRVGEWSEKKDSSGNGSHQATPTRVGLVQIGPTPTRLGSSIQVVNTLKIYFLNSSSLKTT